MSSWNPFVKFYEINCPDGSKKLVYKNVDDAFPFYIHDHQAKLSASIESNLTHDASIDSGYKNRIRGLLYKLDNLNQDLIFLFRAKYVVFQGDPCNNADYLKSSIDGIINRHLRLKEQSILIEKFIQFIHDNPREPELLGSELEKLKNLIDRPDISEVVDAIKSSQELVKSLHEIKS